MKQILAIGIAVIVMLGLTVPALAVDTQVEIVTDGVPPIVKCKWETPDDGDMYYPSYIDEYNQPAWEEGTQVMPNPGEVSTNPGCELIIGCKEVQYWAVVTHPVAMGMVSGVYADVYHPNVQEQANLSGEIVPPEWCGSHKYQVELLPYMASDNLAQVAAFEEANEDHLVTFNGYTAEDVVEQLLQGEAELYMGVEYLCNHQPAGVYEVVVSAAAGGSWSGPVSNPMTFVELNSFLLDFEAIDYGMVAVSYEKQVGGDEDMCTTPGKPTVWNNGNTYINLNVAQDDAGFGFRTVDGQQVWNVHWAARLGDEQEGTKVSYDPNQEPVTLPELLVMCTPTKLDFFIKVDKAPAGAGIYAGELTIGSTVVPFLPCSS